MPVVLPLSECLILAGAVLLTLSGLAGAVVAWNHGWRSVAGVRALTGRYRFLIAIALLGGMLIALGAWVGFGWEMNAFAD
jgi:hypothetical protein